MSLFGDIPIRINGQVIDATWFNTLRTKLLLGFGDIEGQVVQVIQNSVTSQDVTTLNFDKNSFSQIDVEYFCRRKTDSSEKVVRGTFSLQWIVSLAAWRIKEGEFRGDDVGVVFDLLNTAGVVQVRYTSTNQAGANYSGNMLTTYKTWAAI